MQGRIDQGIWSRDLSRIRPSLSSARVGQTNSRIMNSHRTAFAHAGTFFKSDRSRKQFRFRGFSVIFARSVRWGTPATSPRDMLVDFARECVIDKWRLLRVVVAWSTIIIIYLWLLIIYDCDDFTRRKEKEEENGVSNTSIYIYIYIYINIYIYIIACTMKERERERERICVYACVREKEKGKEL